MGREFQINQLHQQLQSNQRIAITALEGMGGIGKTELAWEYAQRSLRQKLYPGGICWLRSRDQEIATQIVDFSKSHLGMKPPDDLEAEAQVSFIWQRWPQGEVLIVIDDVTDYELVAPCLPLANPRFNVLFTTRLDFGQSVRSLCLEELDNKSALALLEQLIGQERVQSQLEDAQTLCGWVGNLPLGLELLGRTLAKKPDWSLQKLIERLASKRLEAQVLIATESGMTAQLGVAAALELSWVELNEAEQELACLLGMFAVAPIPWHLVEGCLSDRDKYELEDTRDEGLIKRNLLKRVGQSTYQLHQIVQEFFRLKLLKSFNDEQSIKSAFCKLITDVAQKLEEFSTIDLIEEVRGSIPHLEEAINKWNNHLSDENLLALYEGIGQFYSGRGNFELGLPWYRKCLEHTRQRLGTKHPIIACSLNNLASLLENIGQYEEAEYFYEQALQIRQELLGEEHSDVAESLINLGGLYYNLGQYKEAEPLFEQGLQITRKLFGEEHAEVALALNNLASLYADQGRYLEAEPLYEQALQIRQKLLGGEHPYVAASLCNLALLYVDQGRYLEAEPLYEQALQMRQKLLGGEHPEVAHSLNNLAKLYVDQGRYLEAEPLYEQALQMRQKLLGGEHPYVATSLNNLAKLYAFQGRYEQAEPLYKQALQMRQKLLSEEHPYIALGINNIALLYTDQGRYEEARPLYIQALEMAMKHLDKEHPYVATILNNLADLYANQGRYGEAEPLYEQALQMRKKLLGNEHPDVAASLNTLAALYNNQGRYTEAEPLFVQALEMTQKLLGEEHPNTVKVHRNLDDFRQKVKEMNT